MITQTSEDSTSSNPSDSSSQFNWFTVINYILYFFLWATIYAIAIQLEFGTVFLIISILYGVWLNTRTGPKKEGEISAYSVFNPNCEPIDGAISAEQFERELMYGTTSLGR